MQLVKYVRATGQIDGVYESAILAMLEAQRVAEDTTYGYLLLETPIPVADQERYAITEERLVEKHPLTIEADPMTFVADGLDECLVTVEPWHACTLHVNGQPYGLTPDDPFLALTSDVPQRFEIILAWMPGYWASPVTVEATADA